MRFRFYSLFVFHRPVAVVAYWLTSNVASLRAGVGSLLGEVSNLSAKYKRNKSTAENAYSVGKRNLTRVVKREKKG